MSYLDRALLVKEAVASDTSLLRKLSSIYASHYAGERYWWRAGGGRAVYEVGSTNVAEGRIEQLLLKLARIGRAEEDYRLAASRRSLRKIARELGSFDAYYDLLSGTVDSLGTFYNESIGLGQLSTTAELGDLGAIPYFHLVVVWNGRIGFLTEGTGGPIAPKGTARYTANGTIQLDYTTIVDGRIVDLEPCDTDIGSINATIPECLRLAARGEPYFYPENRIDLT